MTQFSGSHTSSDSILEIKHEKSAFEQNSQNHSPQQVFRSLVKSSWGISDRRTWALFFHEMIIIFLQMMIKLILILLLFESFSTSQQLIDNTNEIIKVEGNVNQLTKISLPFKHLISATISDDNYQPYLIFSSDRLRIQETKMSEQLPLSKKSLIQDLRTPFSQVYNHIFTISSFIYAFKMPNFFVVMKEQEGYFRMERQFYVPEMLQKDIKFHQISKDTLLIFLDLDNYILMNFDGYWMNKNIFGSNIITSVQFQQTDTSSILAFYSQKLILLSIGNKRISYNGNITIQTEYTPQKIKAIRIEKRAKQKVAWIIDQSVGLIWVSLSNDLRTVNEAKILIARKGCIQLDVKMNEKQIRALLTCNSQFGHSLFLKGIFTYEKQVAILAKLYQPHIEACRTKKYMFYQQKIVSLEKGSLDIFFPSIYKDKKELFYTKNWLSLMGHSAHFLAEDKQNQMLNIYTINKNRLYKYQLIAEDYILQINSPIPLKCSFNLKIQYICSSKISNLRQICVDTLKIEINLHNKNLSFLQQRSVYFGIIMFLFTTILIVAYLCKKKYSRIKIVAFEELKQLTNPSNFKF